MAAPLPTVSNQAQNKHARGLERPGRRWLGAGYLGLFALAACVGCHGQQAAPGDPFLPFMRSRVPPPGTTAPAGTVPMDPYYPNGAPPAAAATPPNPGVPPGAGATPPPTDKYSPRGGFNVPQSSIDRSKVVDPQANEVKAGGTAIARRTLSTPSAGRSEVDTQLTAAKETTATPISTEPISTAPLAATAIATTTSADEPEFDGATVAFDEPARPSTGRPIAQPAATAGAEEPEPEQLARTNDAIDNTGNASSVRIMEPGAQSAAPAESAVASVPASDTPRLRLTAGNPSNRFATKLAETDADTAAPRTLPAAPQVKLLAGDSAADQAAGASSGVVQAVWNEPATGTASPTTRAAAFAAADGGQPYGYEPSYAALRGRLEYSAGARQWKLRYIPIDGTTDQYGGSVVLNDPTRLEGFQPGDFVSVEGGLAADSQAARTYSPRYELTQIAPVR